MPPFDSWELTLPSDGSRYIDVTGLFGHQESLGFGILVHIDVDAQPTHYLFVFFFYLESTTYGNHKCYDNIVCINKGLVCL